MRKADCDVCGATGRPTNQVIMKLAGEGYELRHWCGDCERRAARVTYLRNGLAITNRDPGTALQLERIADALEAMVWGDGIGVRR